MVWYFKYITGKMFINLIICPNSRKTRGLLVTYEYCKMVDMGNII